MFNILFLYRSWIFNSRRFQQGIQSSGSQATREDSAGGVQVPR